MFFSKRKSQDETSGLATRVVVSGQEVVALGDLTLTGERNGTFYVKERVNVMPDSLIIGDITAVDGEISGKVSGNLVCAGELWLKSTAVIEGMLMAKTAVFEPGCVINASVLLSPEVNSKLLLAKIKDAEKVETKKIEEIPPRPISESFISEDKNDSPAKEEKKTVQRITTESPKVNRTTDNTSSEGNTGWW